MTWSRPAARGSAGRAPRGRGGRLSRPRLRRDIRREWPRASGGRGPRIHLRMLADTRGIAISDADAAELTDRFASMPPHPEVPVALRRLRVHGFRLFTLTDNTLDISGRQLEESGGRSDVSSSAWRRVDERAAPSAGAGGGVRSVAAAASTSIRGDACLGAAVPTPGTRSVAVAAGWQAALHPARGQCRTSASDPRPDYVGDDLDANCRPASSSGVPPQRPRSPVGGQEARRRAAPHHPAPLPTNPRRPRHARHPYSRSAKARLPGVPSRH